MPYTATPFGVECPTLCHKLASPLSCPAHPIFIRYPPLLLFIANNFPLFPPFAIHSPTFSHSLPTPFAIHCQPFSSSFSTPLPFTSCPFYSSLPTPMPIELFPLLPTPLHFTAHLWCHLGPTSPVSIRYETSLPFSAHLFAIRS